MLALFWSNGSRYAHFWKEDDDSDNDAINVHLKSSLTEKPRVEGFPSPGHISHIFGMNREYLNTYVILMMGYHEAIKPGFKETFIPWEKAHILRLRKLEQQINL